MLKHILRKKLTKNFQKSPAQFRPKHFSEARIELSPMQYDPTAEPSDDDEESEESEEKSASQPRKRNKNGSSHSKRRRNKYDQIDQNDEDWHVDSDTEAEFVPMLNEDHQRRMAPGGESPHTTIAADQSRTMTTAVHSGAGAGGGVHERRVVAIVTLPPLRRADQPTWSLSSGGPAVIGRCWAVIAGGLVRLVVPAAAVLIYSYQRVLMFM